MSRMVRRPKLSAREQRTQSAAHSLRITVCRTQSAALSLWPRTVSGQNRSRVAASAPPCAKEPHRPIFRPLLSRFLPSRQTQSGPPIARRPETEFRTLSGSLQPLAAICKDWKRAAKSSKDCPLETHSSKLRAAKKERQTIGAAAKRSSKLALSGTARYTLISRARVLRAGRSLALFCLHFS